MLQASKSFSPEVLANSRIMAACFSDSLVHHMRVGLGYISSIPDGRVTSNRQRFAR
jgi:hypothetical protein